MGRRGVGATGDGAIWRDATARWRRAVQMTARRYCRSINERGRPGTARKRKIKPLGPACVHYSTPDYSAPFVNAA